MRTRARAPGALAAIVLGFVAHLPTQANALSVPQTAGGVEGNAFVFAIHTDTVAIGANTTIWLDTDLDRGSGYQIWGTSGGAEYNVNLGPGGVAKLYTGAAGETFVADLDYSYSVDSTTLELAVAESLLAGAQSAVRIYADVNNNAFLPNCYDCFDFIVGSPSIDPPSVTTYGAITLDGDIAEWAAGTRLDTPTSGTAGYALYGLYEVATVPIPGAVWLLGSGVLGLLGVGHTRRKRGQTTAWATRLNASFHAGVSPGE